MKDMVCVHEEFPMMVFVDNSKGGVYMKQEEAIGSGFKGITIETKVCNTCEKEKPVTDFYENHRTKDGYENPCKMCKKKKNEDYRQKKKEDPAKKKGPAAAIIPLKPVALDGDAYPELMAGLEIAAIKHIRTVNHQIIAYIRLGLQGDNLLPEKPV